jgi:hypothetical protein
MNDKTIEIRCPIHGFIQRTNGKSGLSITLCSSAFAGFDSLRGPIWFTPVRCTRALSIRLE